MSEFTPGKWEVDEFGYICADKAVIAKALGKPEVVLGDNRRLRVGKSILSPAYTENILGYSREKWLKELNANARLMAAAPEMYAFINTIAEDIDDSKVDLVKSMQCAVAEQLIANIDVERK